MSKNKQTVSKRYTISELEKIGRLIIGVAETGYKDKKKLYTASFLKGIASGVGGVVGASLAIALLLFVLSLLSEVPLISTVAENLQNTVQQTTR